MAVQATAAKRAKTLANVLVGGRCISTDRYMQASIRVMPVGELQARLKKMGAFLPNCN